MYEMLITYFNTNYGLKLKEKNKCGLGGIKIKSEHNSELEFWNITL